MVLRRFGSNATDGLSTAAQQLAQFGWNEF
jgi:hypothetical protein